jgi:predicted CopG family antitoxin
VQQLPWKIIVASVLTAAERRKRLKLKRIVVCEHNYQALKKVGYAGDSFNDVVSRLLQVYRTYQEKKKQQEKHQQEQENDCDRHIANNDRLPFPGSSSELFGGHDRQQPADLGVI